MKCLQQMYLVMIKEEWATARTFHRYNDAIDYYFELSLKNVVFIAELCADGSVKEKKIVL